MFSSMTGRSVIVTGGTRGIGKGIARVFVGAGANVTIASPTEADLRQAADELSTTGPGAASWCVADVSVEGDVRRMVAHAVERFGGLDVLCANAGIFPQASMTEVPVELWDRVMATNLRGTFLCVRCAADALARSGHGRIIVTSSTTGPLTGIPGWAHYGASKAGQIGFIHSAALELARKGVTINAVLPGNILTESIRTLKPGYREAMERAIPMGHLGTVEDVGHAALFLATDEASFITGQMLVIDGGQMLPESTDVLTGIGM